MLKKQILETAKEHENYLKFMSTRFKEKHDYRPCFMTILKILKFYFQELLKKDKVNKGKKIDFKNLQKTLDEIAKEEGSEGLGWPT